jgi:hypothetical protein
MTTSHSPLRVLKAQADIVAQALKAAERRDLIVPGQFGPYGAKFTEARDRDQVVFGIAMDDKFLKIEMTWATIKATSEAGISEYILRQMRGARDKAN